MITKNNTSEKQPLSHNLIFSCEIENNSIVLKLFGIIPLHKIKINDIAYPRLASQTELNPLKNLCYQIQPLRKKKSSRAYIIESTHQTHSLTLNLTSKTLFMLRQAIGKAHANSYIHSRFK
ncbi:MAG: hypothetical protein CBE26_01515 [Kiritimatiellaceae bacterium TMED266]|nr:MAG: hypothetical protein CBE26_01515 [Kiritimatiellaceae bacterium TMED266]